jgi:hypothetical protein
MDAWQKGSGKALPKHLLMRDTPKSEPTHEQICDFFEL